MRDAGIGPTDVAIKMMREALAILDREGAMMKVAQPTETRSTEAWGFAASIVGQMASRRSTWLLCGIERLETSPVARKRWRLRMLSNSLGSIEDRHEHLNTRLYSEAGKKGGESVD